MVKYEYLMFLKFKKDYKNHISLNLHFFRGLRKGKNEERKKDKIV